MYKERQSPGITVKNRDNHNVLTVTHPDGTEHKYHPSGWTLWLEVPELYIVEQCEAERGVVKPFRAAIRGKGLVDGHGIEVMGDPATRCREVNFEVDPLPDPDAVRSNSFDELLGDDAQWPDKVRPTAILGLTRADWEVGSSDEWFISVRLPQENYAHLERVLRGTEKVAVLVGLQMLGLYDRNWRHLVREKAAWVLFPGEGPENYSFPQTTKGYVSRLSLRQAGRTERLATDDQTAAERKDDVQLDALLTSSTRAPAMVLPGSNLAATAAVTKAIDRLRNVILWVGIAVVLAFVFGGR